MVKTPRPRHAPEDSVIYKIPCGEHSCKEAYFGQTCRGLKNASVNTLQPTTSVTSRALSCSIDTQRTTRPAGKRQRSCTKALDLRRNDSSLNRRSSGPTRTSTRENDSEGTIPSAEFQPWRRSRVPSPPSYISLQSCVICQSIENDFVSKLVLAQYTYVLIIWFPFTSQLSTY